MEEFQYDRFSYSRRILHRSGLVWQFYSWRRYGALRAKPNKGHYALSKLSHKFNSDEYITITQNVDGLLSRSGHNLDSLYEIHGSLFDLKCTSFMCNYVDHNNFKQPLTKALEDTEFEYSNLSTRKRTFDDSDSNDGVDISLSPQFNPVKTILEKIYLHVLYVMTCCDQE